MESATKITAQVAGMRSVRSYRILREIGSGGMAEVFEAISEGPGDFSRRVAIKRILAFAGDDPEMMTMFVDEAKTASLLHHPNIVSILDYGVADGRPFQVLEYVEGYDLRHVLGKHTSEKKVFSPALALYVALEVAHALDHAHRACDDNGKPLGIVHRDISPGNILISTDGAVKLTDFGIALGHHRTTRTQTGVFKGTLLYMAPEQMTQGTIDARSDIFGLGCILHTLLVGESPLKGDNSMLALLCGDRLTLDEGFDEDIRLLLDSALAPSRADRYASASIFGDAISACLIPRLHRDAKSELREWLAPRQSQSPTDSSPLASLFEIEIVAEVDGVREFRTAATAVHRVRPEETRPKEVPVEIPPRRSAKAIYAALALLVLAAAGVGVAMRTPSFLQTSNNDPLERETAQAERLDRAPEPLAAVTDAGTASEVIPRLPTGDAAATQTRAKTTQPKLVRETGSSKARSPERLADQEDRGEIEIGVLVVGGSVLHQAELLVDGKSRGYAPKTLRLPVGQHRLEARLPTGKSHKRTVQVTPTHTQSRPLRWVLN